MLDSFWDDVGGAIGDALRSLMLSLCEVIYKLIVFFFDIFMTLGKAEILHEDTIAEFYERVGLILGLFMIFRVTFSLIQYVMNPDLMADKQKGLFNIVKRVFIVVVLLGVTRPLFNFAYEAQEMIVTSNIIPKVITGKNIDSSNSGANLAWYTFTSFYSFNDNAIEDYVPDTDKNEPIDAKTLCPEFRDGENQNSLIKSDFMINSSLKYARNCVNQKINVKVPGYENKATKDYLIDFDGNGLLAVVVGGFILYMILMYVIQVGVRVVQLAYLQLIAPIPIIGYLAPKGEDTLNKWFKQCVTTYLDFFIRIAILYFVVFIIELLISNDYDVFSESLGDVSKWGITFINIIMIIALLLFAQKVPKLLKELFPSLGGGAASFDFGLSAKKNITEPLKWAYKSTPLGWAPRALGWAGKKTIGAIDRKVHNVSRPRGKFGQYMDKLMPERAKDIAANRQAKVDERLRSEKESLGKHIMNTATHRDKNGDLVFDADKAFVGHGSNDYIESYNKVKSAKGDMNKAKKLVEDVDKELSRAYNLPTDTEKQIRYRDEQIAIAQKRRDAAGKNYGAYEAKFTQAKENHDSLKKMAKYKKFADIEDAYKYYTDRNPEFVEMPAASRSHSNQQNTNQYQNNQQNINQYQNNQQNINQYQNNQQNANGNNSSDNYEQITWDEYVKMDDKVSETNMNVVNAIAKEPFTEKVTEALEEFQKADHERDAAAERLEEQEASNGSNVVTPIETPNNNESSIAKATGSNITKSQLLKMKRQLENNRRKLEIEYNKLETKKMSSSGKFDDSQFTKIKNQMNSIDRDIQKIDSMLNNL